MKTGMTNFNVNMYNEKIELSLFMFTLKLVIPAFIIIAV